MNQKEKKEIRALEQERIIRIIKKMIKDGYVNINIKLLKKLLNA